MSPTLNPPASIAALPARRVLRAWLLLALLPALLLARPVHAEVDMDGASDPPARVGRVSQLRGSVDLSREPGAAWEPARVNQPVTTQTAFWVPPGSQAELRIGSAAVRLDGNTQAAFSQLDDHGIALDLAQGTVRARVRNLPTGDAFSLSADGVRAEALMPGDYRVGYDPDRSVYTVRALAGRMRVVTPTNSVDLAPGQESVIERATGFLQLRTASTERDDFDLWAEARDREHDRLIASRYVSPEVTGVEALDDHGRWEIDNGYGAIWYPSAVPYGWAPYRYGRWVWVAPWGWTWADDSPWGFAPFHYGRWALVGHRWGWVPGPIVARPVWAPALVGWVGGHSGRFSWSIGFGSPVGWFPLAPYEYYYPPYRHSVVYIDRVNTVRERPPRDPQRGDPQRPRERDPQRADVRDPQRDGLPRYRYAQSRDALTVVDEDSFRNARPVNRHRIALDPQQVAALRPVLGQTPAAGGVAPGRSAQAPGLPPRARVEALPAPPSARPADPQGARPSADRGRGDGGARPPAPPRTASDLAPARGPQEARPRRDPEPDAARRPAAAPDGQRQPPVSDAPRRPVVPDVQRRPVAPEVQQRAPNGVSPPARAPRERPPGAEPRAERRVPLRQELLAPGSGPRPAAPAASPWSAAPGQLRPEAPRAPERGPRAERAERPAGGARADRQAQRYNER